MKYIFKHSGKKEISEIVDNEANKLTTLLFKMHKTFCNNCRDIFESYQTLGIKLNEVYDKKLSTYMFLDTRLWTQTPVSCVQDTTSRAE